MVTKNWLQGNSNSDPLSQLQVKVHAFVHWTISVNAYSSRLKEVYIPSLWLLTVFKDDFSFLLLISL